MVGDIQSYTHPRNPTVWKWRELYRAKEKPFSFLACMATNIYEKGVDICVYPVRGGYNAIYRIMYTESRKKKKKKKI
jgi:hypothetical protein